MAFLNLLAVAENMPVPKGMWEWFLLNVFDFITHYGWRIIVFTLCLKLVLSPLDVYQRYVMRKNQRIKERIEPEMLKLQAQYGNNRQILQQKQMELNKREGFSYFGSCLPMLVPIIIFISLFSGLNTISQYSSMKQYLHLYDVYETAHVRILEENGIRKSDSGFEIIDPLTFEGSINLINEKAIKGAQEEVAKAYENDYKVTFIWIKNIWSPDVPWKKPIPDNTAFIKSIGKYASDPDRSGLTKPMLESIISSDTYNRVTLSIRTNEDENKINGWLILPILSVGLSFLSQLLSTRQQKKSGMDAGPQAQTTMKMMMFFMPIMMGVFALNYTSVFTLYIVTNSVITLLINLSSTKVLTLIDIMNERRAKIVKKADADGGEIEVVRYGRRDPNEVKGADDKRYNKKIDKYNKK